MEEYEIETSREGIKLIRPNVNQTYSFIEGLCAADPQNPTGDMLPRREWQAKVLAPLIEYGKVCDGSKGSFNDRKYRFSGASVNPSGNLEIMLGETYYQANYADIYIGLLLKMQYCKKRELPILVIDGLILQGLLE